MKEEMYSYSDTVNELLARYGVKFGIYKNGTFNEQLFPFDMIPRKISIMSAAKTSKTRLKKSPALRLHNAS